MTAHRFELRVYYEDTDLAGIVYYANYLKFIERARTEALLAAGIDQVALERGQGTVFAVRALSVDYRAPARFQDVLTVRTTAAAVTAARARLIQEVWRTDELLVAAEVDVVCLGRDGRPRRLPEPVRAALGGMLPGL
ncbi:MAG: tol-pal system-associated acyl-CoA thioesterase [Rhodobacteraceae bacterium]|nr:tol-pal system-associated acyl-CoA thioesterase [Paracoccaceae bacterium]